MKHFNFTKKDFLTIPNAITLIRILLLPFIVYSWITLENVTLTIVLVAISALSDVVDGKIARKFNMISPVGKILDPIADKLSLFTLFVCLLRNYSLFIYFAIFYVVKELWVALFGYLTVVKTGDVLQAKWYGKMSTAVIYSLLALLLLFPNYLSAYGNIIIIICMATLIFAMIMYTIHFVTYIKKHKTA